MVSLDFAVARGAPRPDISHIDRARKLRDRTGEIADWIVANVPWSVAVNDWPCFHDRWPLLTRDELAAVEDELARRGAALDGGDADLDAIAAALTGRKTCWTAAADWLTMNPGADIAHPDFLRLFGRLSRAELILAAIEHRRRIVNGRAEAPPRP